MRYIQSIVISTLIAVFIPACKTHSPTADNAETESTMPSDKTPRNKTSRASDRDFRQGPSLENPETVLNWIHDLKPLPNGQQPRLRLPVAVVRGEPFSGEPDQYFAGFSTNAEAGPLLELRLDDTGLGISLSDRLRQFCPEAQLPCIIQVEGTWGPLLELPGQDSAPTIALIQVFRYEGDTNLGNEEIFIFAEE